MHHLTANPQPRRVDPNAAGTLAFGALIALIRKIEVDFRATTGHHGRPNPLRL